MKNGKPRLVPLLTNDTEMDPQEIVGIYRKRWEIELLFKQLKQNFPLRYFYGQSANAIKIQIWVSLIANLLLMVIQKWIKRTWSFSGLATTVRIMLMCYINCYSYLEHPEMDWIKRIEEEKKKRRQVPFIQAVIREGAYFLKIPSTTPIYWLCGRFFILFGILADSNSYKYEI